MATPTFTRYLLQGGRSPGGHIEHGPILSALAVATMMTAALVSRGALIVPASKDGHNPSLAEVRRTLRNEAIDTMLSQVADVETVAAVSVVGRSEIIPMSPTGRYLLLIDPMHGLSGLDDNMSVGSAFSLLEVRHPGAWREEDFLQPGSQQVCAGIALFGPRTLFVLSNGDGVDGFTLNREVGNFVLTHPHMMIPADARVFAIDASESRYWPAPVRRYVEECVQGTDGPRGHDFSMRWNASAIVGVFRTLKSGGIFLAPDNGHEAGWVPPLLHTAAPLAFLAEQAGGFASTGGRRVLDIVPDALSTRVPLFLGDASEVSRLEGYFSEEHRVDDEVTFHPLFRRRTLFMY